MDSKTETKRIIYEDIYALVLNKSISSISIDSINYTYKDIPKDGYLGNVIIAKKYISLLQHFNLKDLKEFLAVKDYNIMLITKKNKFIGIHVTHHSAYNFIKRFIYTYLLDTNAFEFSSDSNKKFLIYFNEFCNLYKSGNKLLGDNKIIIECMEALLFNSVFFDYNSTGRLRDKLAFKERDQIRKDTIRYISHPFLFVVADEVLKTVELYSSCYDFRFVNGFIKDESGYDKWFKTKIGD